MKKEMSSALNIQGVSFAIRGDYPRSLEYFKRVLEIDEERGNAVEITNTLANIGSVYLELGDYPKAVDFYQKSLKIQQDFSNTDGVANALNNIGQIFARQGDLPKALDHGILGAGLFADKQNTPVFEGAIDRHTGARVRRCFRRIKITDIDQVFWVGNIQTV